MHGSSNEAGPPLSGATLDGAGLADPAPVTDYRVRPATAADADAICRIYNQGIEDRVATLETELRTPEERRRWLANRSPRHPVVVAEPTEPRFVGGHGGGETEPGRTFVRPPTEGSGPADPGVKAEVKRGRAAPLSGHPRKAPAPRTPGVKAEVKRGRAAPLSGHPRRAPAPRTPGVKAEVKRGRAAPLSGHPRKAPAPRTPLQWSAGGASTSSTRGRPTGSSPTSRSTSSGPGAAGAWGARCSKR